ncbi:hypothetical protein VT98_12091 [Candidatus Electrothrix communis]|uniref:Uncharacterized protein n=1 Tax=Candidatus Electrothrix communis TaxID=1859133 RepID=A0A3S4TCI5_9BACT|nr:hypothetical protein VT98_12091 [Candidatus Electrothrix communis]
MKPGQIIPVVLSILLLAATSARAEVKGVSFLHRTKAKSVLKLDCDEERTGTAPPAYTCYNKNGKEQSITPGPEWQLVKLSPACLLNTVTDTVDTSCAGLPNRESNPGYISVKRTRKSSKFQNNGNRSLLMTLVAVPERQMWLS